MENIIIYGLITLFVIMILSMILNERAMQLLRPEEKERLLDELNDQRVYFSTYNLIVILLFLLLLLLKINLYQKLIALIICILVLISLIISINVLTIKKLKKIKIPYSYIRKYRFISILKYLALPIIIITGILDIYFNLFTELQKML